jgi:hypothetical protein
MKRLLPLLILFALWAQSASAQIAYDAGSSGGVFSTSWNHTVGTGSNRALIVQAFDDNGGSDLLTAVKWNTTESLTKITDVQTPGDRWVSLWYLLNPSSGTHSITLTTTAGAMKGSAISLTGVGALDQQTTATASNVLSVSSTLTVATNAWVISAVKEISGFGTLTVTNGTDDPSAVGSGLHGVYGGPFTGSLTTTATGSSNSFWGMVSASFTVSGGGPPASGPAPCTFRLLGVGCEVP